MDKEMPSQATNDLHGLAEYTSAASPVRIANRDEDAYEMLTVIKHQDRILRRALFETALEAAIIEETQASGKRPPADSIRLARKLGMMMSAQKAIPALTSQTEIPDGVEASDG